VARLERELETPIKISSLSLHCSFHLWFMIAGRSDIWIILH